MSRHWEREVNKLKQSIVHLGEVVEDQVIKGIEAISTNNLSLAQQTVDLDSKVDELEVELEEECLKLLALHQPVAQDLRFVVAVLKINNDLERIGDLAANIAERAKQLCELSDISIPEEIREMSAKTKLMLRKCLLSLVEEDAGLARAVLQADDEIDAMHREAYVRTASHIQKLPEEAEAVIILLSVSRYLERIADLASNIAEDVLYMLEGQIVRHTQAV